LPQGREVVEEVVDRARIKRRRRVGRSRWSEDGKEGRRGETGEMEGGQVTGRTVDNAPGQDRAYLQAGKQWS
jgi:hypothetical protein